MSNTPRAKGGLSRPKLFLREGSDARQRAHTDGHRASQSTPVFTGYCHVEADGRF